MLTTTENAIRAHRHRRMILAALCGAMLSASGMGISAANDEWGAACFFLGVMTVCGATVMHAVQCITDIAIGLEADDADD